MPFASALYSIGDTTTLLPPCHHSCAPSHPATGPFTPSYFRNQFWAGLGPDLDHLQGLGQRPGLLQ